MEASNNFLVNKMDLLEQNAFFRMKNFSMELCFVLKQSDNGFTASKTNYFCKNKLSTPKDNLLFLMFDGVKKTFVYFVVVLS